MVSSATKRLNRELYRQIGDMVQIKLAVADAIERLTMAELEKSVKNNLHNDDLHNDDLHNDDLHKEGRLYLVSVRADNESNAPDEN